MQKVNRTDLDVKRGKFAREAAMEEFGPRRYWSAHDADGFEDLPPDAIERRRYEAWAR